MHINQMKGMSEGQFTINQTFFEKQFDATSEISAENDSVSINTVTTGSVTAASNSSDETAETKTNMGDLECRTFDGSYNNLSKPSWGAIGSQLLRITGEAYADGKSALAVRGCSERTNPRNISNLICRQKGVKENRNRLSDFVWTWGQFLDHEIDLTETVNEEASFSAPANDPLAAGATIPFKTF